MIYQLAATLLFYQTDQYEAKVQQTKIFIIPKVYQFLFTWAGLAVFHILDTIYVCNAHTFKVVAIYL